MCIRDSTCDDLLARLALVPRTLEARGLDASPLIRNKLAGAGDAQSAAIVDIILRDEIGHVAIGNYWYKRLCAEQGREPVACYAELDVYKRQGVAIALIEEVEVGCVDLRAAQPAERQPGLRHFLAVLADLLALVVAHRRQEGVEVGIARVGPVELHAFAHHEAGLAQGAQVGGGRKQQVQRRHLDLSLIHI